MSDTRKAPWPQEFVDALNEYQTAREFHPYTCGKRSDSPHPFKNGDNGVLVATVNGWECPDCDYTQDWAHSWHLAGDGDE